MNIAYFCVFLVLVVNVIHTEKGVRLAYATATIMSIIACALFMSICYGFWTCLSAFLRTELHNYFSEVDISVFKAFLTIIFLILLPFQLIYTFRLSGKFFVKRGAITREQYQRNFRKRSNHAICAETENDRG